MCCVHSAMSSDDDPVHMPLSLLLSFATSEIGGLRKCFVGGIWFGGGGPVVVMAVTITDHIYGHWYLHNKHMHACVGGEDVWNMSSMNKGASQAQYNAIWDHYTIFIFGSDLPLGTASQPDTTHNKKDIGEFSWLCYIYSHAKTLYTSAFHLPKSIHIYR